MKILKEKMMLNDLRTTLHLCDECNEILIQREEGQHVVLLTLDKYNEIKAEVYKQIHKDKK